jgi:hypothetical protein
MTKSPEPWQLAIPFARLVEATIGPVVADFGFVSSVQQPNLIHFDNGNIYLDVSHHPHDGEVAIDFGRLGADERFSFLLYLRSKAPQDAAANLDGVSWTSEDVQVMLEHLARALREHASPILRGQSDAFDSMKSLHWWDIPGAPGMSKRPESR